MQKFDNQRSLAQHTIDVLDILCSSDSGTTPGPEAIAARIRKMREEAACYTEVSMEISRLYRNVGYNIPGVRCYYVIRERRVGYLQQFSYAAEPDGDYRVYDTYDEAKVAAGNILSFENNPEALYSGLTHSHIAYWVYCSKRDLARAEEERLLCQRQADTANERLAYIRNNFISLQQQPIRPLSDT